MATLCPFLCILYVQPDQSSSCLGSDLSVDDIDAFVGVDMLLEQL